MPFSSLNPDGSNRCFIAPIRNVNHADDLRYDSTTGELGYTASTQNIKKDIQDISDQEIEALLNLRPRYFRYIEDDQPDIGLIAEEVFEVAPQLVYLRDGVPVNIRWNSITSYLVKKCQNLEKELRCLEQDLKNDWINKCHLI